MKEPCFWEDRLVDLPLCKDLKHNFQKIKEEVLKFIAMPNALHDYPKYKIEHNNQTIDLYSNIWQAVPLSKYDAEFLDTESDTPQAEYTRSVITFAKKNCPTVTRCIEELEDKGFIRNVFISKLLPGSDIQPHRGRDNKFMRLHVCVDADPECKLTVGHETRTWVEGEILAFKDGGVKLHSVQHKGTKQRVVLSIDIDLQYIKDYIIIK
jgi:hypothetical protein